jgi:hypothetical protein
MPEEVLGRIVVPIADQFCRIATSVTFSSIDRSSMEGGRILRLRTAQDVLIDPSR